MKVIGACRLREPQNLGGIPLSSSATTEQESDLLPMMSTAAAFSSSLRATTHWRPEIRIRSCDSISIFAAHSGDCDQPSIRKPSPSASNDRTGWRSSTKTPLECHSCNREVNKSLSLNPTKEKKNHKHHMNSFWKLKCYPMIRAKIDPYSTNLRRIPVDPGILISTTSDLRPRG